MSPSVTSTPAAVAAFATADAGVSGPIGRTHSMEETVAEGRKFLSQLCDTRVTRSAAHVLLRPRTAASAPSSPHKATKKSSPGSGKATKKARKQALTKAGSGQELAARFAALPYGLRRLPHRMANTQQQHQQQHSNKKRTARSTNTNTNKRKKRLQRKTTMEQVVLDSRMICHDLFFFLRLAAAQAAARGVQRRSTPMSSTPAATAAAAAASTSTPSVAAPPSAYMTRASLAHAPQTLKRGKALRRSSTMEQVVIDGLKFAPLFAGKTRSSTPSTPRP